MTEQFLPPSLPAIESYLEGDFEFVAFSGRPGEGVLSGTVLKFQYEPKGRVYIFECISMENGGFTGRMEGWLSEFDKGILRAERANVTLEGLHLNSEGEDSATGRATFSGENEGGSTRLTAPFTKLEQTSAPQIGDHLLALSLHELQLAPFMVVEAQELLQKTVGYLTTRAAHDESPAIAASYRRAAEIISKDLLSEEIQTN